MGKTFEERANNVWGNFTGTIKAIVEIVQFILTMIGFGLLLLLALVLLIGVAYLLYYLIVVL